MRSSILLPQVRSRWRGAWWEWTERSFFIRFASLDSMRIALAFRAFFAVLGGADRAERIRRALDANPAPLSIPDRKESVTPAGERPPTVDAAAKEPALKSSARSDALTLLTVLQRDARLLDLVTEALDGYTDAQIGGAARNVLRDTRQSLEKAFGLKRLTSQSEGSVVEIPKQASPLRWRVSGNPSHAKGELVHAGWMATHVELPKWNGQSADAMVISPIEVETRS